MKHIRTSEIHRCVHCLRNFFSFSGIQGSKPLVSKKGGFWRTLLHAFNSSWYENYNQYLLFKSVFGFQCIGTPTPTDYSTWIWNSSSRFSVSDKTPTRTQAAGRAQGFSRRGTKTNLWNGENVPMMCCSEHTVRAVVFMTSSSNPHVVLCFQLNWRGWALFSILLELVPCRQVRGARREHRANQADHFHVRDRRVLPDDVRDGAKRLSETLPTTRLS